MKFYNTNFLNISFNHNSGFIELSRMKQTTRHGTTFDYIDTSVKLIEGITIKVKDTLYINITLHKASEDGKILFYKYDSSIEYTKFIKNDINLNSVIFIYEEKEPWFNILVNNDVCFRVDPMFSKINPSSQFENIIYVPKDKSLIIKNFLDDGGYVNTPLNPKNYFGILFKNVKYEYLGLIGLNNEIRITYETHYILSEYNMRFMKINAMIL